MKQVIGYGIISAISRRSVLRKVTCRKPFVVRSKDRLRPKKAGVSSSDIPGLLERTYVMCTRDNSVRMARMRAFCDSEYLRPLEVRNLQPGDLIFIRGTQGVAGPIKKLTRSPYTHIAGVVFDNQLIESQGLRRTGYEAVETYRGVADVYTCNTLSVTQRHEVISYVKREIGTKYDYLLVGWLACRLLIGEWMPLFASKRRRICTTLWADAYKAAGVELCPDSEHPTPGQLAESKLLRYVGSF